MAAIFQELLNVAGIFIVFVRTYLIPTAAADINIIHVAIWLPVTLALLGGTVGFLKGMWGGGGRRRRS